MTYGSEGQSEPGRSGPPTWTAADMDRRAVMFWMFHEGGASYGAPRARSRAASGKAVNTGC